MPTAVVLEGPLDVGVLAASLAAVVARHESLRTTFGEVEGEPVQLIETAPEVRLPKVDLRALAAPFRRAELRRLAGKEGRRPFDLARGPLLRGTLIVLAESEHAVLLTLHHIVSDGWSMGVLVRELGTLYEAFLEGRPSPLAPLAIQYADFALWQRRWLVGEVLEAELGYWRRRLANLPTLELPTDRPRPAVLTPRGASRGFAVAAELSEDLRRLSRERGATLFMTLLASWTVLLSRYSGQGDVAVGSPIAGRNHAKTEDLIGFFVNTLVLRTDLSGIGSVVELLAAVREGALEAYAHQDLPFERLVEELQPERDLSRTALFQVLFNLQNAPAPRLRMPGLQASPLGEGADAAKFDLTLTLSELGGRLGGTLTYRAELFAATTAERMLVHYEHLLTALVRHPELPPSALSLLSIAERHQLLVEWNDTWTAYADAAPLPHGTGLSLHELFMAAAQRIPEAPALLWKDQWLTYGELDRRSNRLAWHLRRLGVAPEVRVALAMERSPEMIVGLLGILKAGGAYVPIDPAYPVERRLLMLTDSGAIGLVIRGRLDAELLEAGAWVLDLDAEEMPANDLPIGSISGPEQLAYVIYTSGSTGRPKGVSIEHRSAVALTLWARREFSAAELSGVLASTSLCFDLSVFEIFVPLAWGGRVILAESALELPVLAAASEVSLLNTVPSVAAELVRGGGLPASVRTVNLAGEPLPAALAARLYATGTVERVMNLYGPSEDTTYSTGARVPRDGERVPAIGRPVSGTRTYVVDWSGGTVPAGVAGELWLGGAGLARGYLGRPDLTAERFVSDPFGEPGGRLYRTGDLARWSVAGDLEFLGRIDHQVKIRGFRIELGEIEAVLAAHPAVGDCVVLALRSSEGIAHLAAYVVGRSGEAPGIAELRDHLQKSLPDHMIPSAFVPLEALPLTPNGKVDRRALPAPKRLRADEEGQAAAGDPVEELLAGIWAEVLKLGRVGIYDDFFALGGHSLLATQVVSRIRAVLGVELPLRQLFESSTVAKLTAAVRAAREQDAPPAPLLVPLPRERNLPLSFAQQRLWFLDRLEPGSAVYNIPTAVVLEGPLDVGVLAASLAAVVARHESLRTTFGEVEGE
ncbi:MAG TPA: amino acid adenylation domain-containing protein, partial [Thermoanaerobaculia bacterium]|nr:amino acid adenylation domain-containing protein [Thermoanaerobaculia bacterium]